MSAEPFIYHQEQPEQLFLEAWMKSYPWIMAGFTTKLGGVSQGRFFSQNLGLHVGDQDEQVLHNRQDMATRLGFDFTAWTSANQTHGTAHKEVTQQERGRGRDSLATAFPDTDALYTQEGNILLTSFYADCVPLLFLDPVKRVIGVAHAGWKGTVGQIGTKLIHKWVERYDSKVEDLRVAIGPAIGGCCYEVTDHVIDHLNPYKKSLSPSAIAELGQGKYKLDLKQVNVDFLLQAGILAGHIEVSRWCTSCNQNLFFSHRRDGGRTGRMAAFIAIKEE